MGLDDFLISTGVDQLIRLVKEKGRVELNAAAAELKQPPKTIEDWAKVLENEGLVTIEYKLTRSYLVWKQPTKEEVAQKSQKLAAKAEGTRVEVEMLLAKVKDEGKELESMKKELQGLSSPQVSLEENAKLRAEIGAIDEEFTKRAYAAAERLSKLKEKALSGAQKQAAKDAPKKGAAVEELKREMSVLKRFEETLTAQIAESEGAFASMEQKIGELKARIESSNASEVASQVSRELSEAKALKNELLGAIEAVTEEVQAIDGKIAALERRASTLIDGDGSVAEARRKLAELRRISDESRRQQAAVKERLGDSLALLKKQSARIGEIVRLAEGEGAGTEALKNEYVEIADEMSRAAEELSRKQSEVSARIQQQMAALVRAQTAPSGRLPREEVQKLSFLLSELSRQQQALEGKVRSLYKESEVISLQAATQSQSSPQGAQMGGHPEHAALVERIKISQQDEADFERKREELRSLIKRMWEESRDGGS